jgi:predicted RNA-binding Zn ribbon-like protein
LVETTVEAERTPRQLPVVGGHLALDFANTVDDPDGAERYDHAGTYPELVGWSARIGILQPDQADDLLQTAGEQPRAASSALQRAQKLRRVLNEIFSKIAAINNGESGTVAAKWPDLRPFVSDALTHAELDLRRQHVEEPGHAGYQLSWPMTARLDSMLWPISVAAVDLLTGTQLHRLKKCAGCPWVFLDQSKNLSRRWCAMNDCGTHEKIRRYVSRRAARKRAG